MDEISTRILLVDDHPLVRSALRRLISTFTFSSKIYEAGNGKEAIEFLSRNQIDLVLLDIQMPVMNGIETMSRIRILKDRPKVIVLTQFDEETLIVHMLKHGVNGFIFKNVETNELENAITHVIDDGVYYDAGILKVLQDNFSRNEDCANLGLTHREHQVMNLLIEGKSSKEISARLNLKKLTVDSYKKELLKKTKCSNTVELISLAYRTGMLSGSLHLNSPVQP